MKKVVEKTLKFKLAPLVEEDNNIPRRIIKADHCRSCKEGSKGFKTW